ncbi:uncharacterized protein [Euphorbia lathyris]|uniref:uncharacterized protein isoform X2 n=1 Tax=Euphorbia lathyris TaxID=212925 RepID=UPI003313137C
MPRPGPRPYECVRRAWHSDRHQPIRGSLIQEIFSSSTKKNKEWQEKLPIVVLKAEEIMYSKANSEAEYMDLKTLWDRSNDAINTIIRLDESAETGDLLQPCIEAALSLGCTPRRTSRSQRNCHPRCYLIEPNNIIEPNPATNPTRLIKPTTLSSTHPGSQLQNLVSQNMGVSTNKFPFPTHLSNYNNQCLPLENSPVSSLCSVYPLYYGTCLEAQNGPGTIPNSVPSVLEPVTIGGVGQSLFSSNDAAAAIRLNQTESIDCLMNQHGMGCDLSLRLGSGSGSRSLSAPSSRQLGNVDVGYRKISNLIPGKEKEFSFFTKVVNTDNPLESCSTKSSDHGSMYASMKKRKAVFGQSADNQAYCWQPKVPRNDLTGRTKSTGT